MKVRVEWTEVRRMSAVIDAESLDEVRENWAMGYESGMVDDIEYEGEEIDGGIQWESVEISPA